MIDVEERARRAGVAVRADARARASRMAPPEPRAARPSRPVLVAAGVGLVALLVAVAVVTGTDPRTIEIDPLLPAPAEPDGALPVPDVGDVVAVQLVDGTPVFVTQPEPGEVLVLDAVDPYLPQGAGHLLFFCRSDGLLESAILGSRFDQRGNLLGGPGPTGLPLYPNELAADGRTVRVIGGRGPAPARDAPRGEPGAPRGPRCLYDEATGMSDVMVHRRPTDVPQLGGGEVPDDRWVWAALLLTGPVDRLVVCDVDGTCGAGPIVATAVLQPPEDVVPPTIFVALARTVDDGRIDLLFASDGILMPEIRAWHPFHLVEFPE